jgi:hypothetical protein
MRIHDVAREAATASHERKRHRAIFFSTHIDDARYRVILHEQYLISPIGPKVVAPLRSDSFFSPPCFFSAAIGRAVPDRKYPPQRG